MRSLLHKSSNVLRLSASFKCVSGYSEIGTAINRTVYCQCLFYSSFYVNSVSGIDYNRCEEIA